MRRHIPETVTPGYGTGLLRKSRREAALPSGVRREPSRSVPAIFAQGTRVWLRLQSVGLNQLLPAECTLLTCILDLFAALGALRCRYAPQLTIFGPAQIALSA
jgi:hypothetical protein